MTRRKWTRLRRQRPELFAGMEFDYAWENLDPRILRGISKAGAITALTDYRLSLQTPAPAADRSALRAQKILEARDRKERAKRMIETVRKIHAKAKTLPWTDQTSGSSQNSSTAAASGST